MEEFVASNHEVGVQVPPGVLFIVVEILKQFISEARRKLSVPFDPKDLDDRGRFVTDWNKAVKGEMTLDDVAAKWDLTPSSTRMRASTLRNKYGAKLLSFGRGRPAHSIKPDKPTVSDDPSAPSGQLQLMEPEKQGKKVNFSDEELIDIINASSKSTLKDVAEDIGMPYQLLAKKARAFREAGLIGSHARGKRGRNFVVDNDEFAEIWNESDSYNEIVSALKSLGEHPENLVKTRIASRASNLRRLKGYELKSFEHHRGFTAKKAKKATLPPEPKDLDVDEDEPESGEIELSDEFFDIEDLEF